MSQSLQEMFGLAEPMHLMRQQDIDAGINPSGAALRHRLTARERRGMVAYLRSAEMRDAMMAFALTFVGAMMFLIG